MVNKVCNLRIMDDSDGVMNKSILDVGGSILSISQFTLYADCKKGRRYYIVSTQIKKASRIRITQNAYRFKAVSVLLLLFYEPDTIFFKNRNFFTANSAYIPYSHTTAF